ncbi:MAG: hypothetical protein WA172_00715 [Terriglobales bacterium]
MKSLAQPAFAALTFEATTIVSPEAALLITDRSVSAEPSSASDVTVSVVAKPGMAMPCTSKITVTEGSTACRRRSRNFGL